ncbi:hypothetical protein F4859DRAFT_178991 [Xylaria cf. heliscus]|nr:hypothetical protein F4859DRAFT_178991 [Xylaria cf. heliscus]
MCQRHDFFYMCGCRVIDPETGKDKFEIEKCKRRQRFATVCEKITMALPRWVKDTYCDDPDCPAYPESS